MSEKLSIVGDVRKALQDFLAPELAEVKVKLQALSEGQKQLEISIRDGMKEMEARLIREIKASEQKLALMFKLSEAMAEVEDLKNENEQLKREKTQ